MQLLKILIIEDQRMVAINIKEYLEETGYEVALAFSYEEGLATFQTFQPDLVLLDIKLSDKPDAPDGVDLAREISRRSNTPFIFLSGNAQDQVLRNKAKAVNPAGFLVKPPNLFQIQLAIELAIETSKTNQALDKEYIFLKNGKAFIRIEFNELGWIKADRNLSEITLAEKTIHVSLNLAAIEKDYSSSRLMRVHKSYMVNLSKIVRTKGNMLFLKVGKNELRVTIGRVYRDEFWAKFK